MPRQSQIFILKGIFSESVKGLIPAWLWEVLGLPFLSSTSPDDICYRCQETDSGVYTCLASSSSGETSWSGVLTVKGKASLHAVLHA